MHVHTDWHGAEQYIYTGRLPPPLPLYSSSRAHGSVALHDPYANATVAAQRVVFEVHCHWHGLHGPLFDVYLPTVEARTAARLTDDDWQVLVDALHQYRHSPRLDPPWCPYPRSNVDPIIEVAWETLIPAAPLGTRTLEALRSSRDDYETVEASDDDGAGWWSFEHLLYTFGFLVAAFAMAGVDVLWDERCYAGSDEPDQERRHRPRSKRTHGRTRRARVVA